MQTVDLMQPFPPSLPVTASVADARRALEASADGHLLVLEGDRLVGVLSDRDLLSAEDAQPVREVMSADPVTATADEPLVSAMVEILTRSIGCLPVVEGEKVLGLITDLGLVRRFARAADAGLTDDEDPPVSDVMSTATVVVFPATTIREADETCRTRRIRHLPVLEGERLVGVLSDRDLRHARRQGLGEETPVRDVMTPDALAVSKGARTSAAAAMMAEHGVRSVAVREGDRFCGIVTATDIVDRVMNSFWRDDVEIPST